MTNTTKTVLVTGGAGFIGSYLIETLVKDPANTVISLDNYFIGSKDNHVEGAKYREGHTKDIGQHISEDIDLVFHLGEYSRVEQSFDEVDTVWDLNIAGTFAVLEFCRTKKAKLVYAGSSTKFADGGMGRDQSPYAWMKASNTELVQNYGEWYGIDYAITYFYNAYGDRVLSTGKYASVIGRFIELYKAGKPITVVAPGTQTRNFTHVDDIVRGLLLVGEKGQGDEYGLGSDEAYSMLEVAKMFSDDIEMLPERKGNRMGGKVDTARVRNEFGWKPQHDLKDYIHNIVSS